MYSTSGETVTNLRRKPRATEVAAEKDGGVRRGAEEKRGNEKSSSHRFSILVSEDMAKGF